VSSLNRQRESLIFWARSYAAFAIAPQASIADWLTDLDASLERSKAFFAGQPVVLDLSAVDLSPIDIGKLVANLEKRSVRVLGIEGIDPAKWQPGLPLLLRRGTRSVDPSGLIGASTEPSATASPTLQKPQPGSLMIKDPVRSGQSVVFMDGDVTVLGSVASGAEVIAGGSIHVYGALRGRALAGATGDSSARIFCHCVEAELLAIGSYYKTADEIEAGLHRRPAQAWLDGATLKISAMN